MKLNVCLAGAAAGSSLLSMEISKPKICSWSALSRALTEEKFARDSQRLDSRFDHS
jgi:hypothetical protein